MKLAEDSIKEIITGDGSSSFFSGKYGESYHSVSGAVEEAFEKHARPSGVAELAKSGKVRILDVCFGLGYNSAAAMDVILESRLDCEIEIVGLENDKAIINKIKEISPRIMSYGAIKDLADGNLEYSREGISIKVLLGDAQKTIKRAGEGFDVVFHDPFSPKKCPELWTEEFFKELVKHMKKGGVLTTYSCARVVRENLKKAGFIVKDGPRVGRRAPSTIAFLIPNAFK